MCGFLGIVPFHCGGGGFHYVKETDIVDTFCLPLLFIEK